MLTIRSTDTTVRMVKQTTLDGEYMLIGRQTPETSQVLSTFTDDPSQAVQVNGSGIQDVQFQDGFKMTVRASQPMSVNTNVINGVSTSMLTDSSQPVNNYRYLVTTNLAAVQPGLNQMMALVQMPLNADRLMSMALRMGATATDQVQLGIQQRPVLANPGGAVGNLNGGRQKRQATSTSSATDGTQTASTSSAADPNATGSTSTIATDAAQQTQPPNNNQGGSGQPNPVQGGNPVATQLLLAPTFTPVAAQNALDRTNGRLAVMVNQLDGEFIVTMGLNKAGGTPQQGQPIQNQPQQGQTPTQERPVQQVPGQAPTQALGGAAPTGALPGSATQLPTRPAKRQLPPPSSNGVIMTMAELQEMVQFQKTGGGLPVMAMMEAFANSQGRTLNVPSSSGLSLRSPFPVTDDSPAARNVRAVKFQG